jgi:hypothetical protein
MRSRWRDTQRVRDTVEGVKLRSAAVVALTVMLLAGCSTPQAEKSPVGGDGPVVEVTRLLTSQVASQRISPLSAARVYGYSFWGGWSAHEAGLHDDTAAWVTAEIGRTLMVNRYAVTEFSAFQQRRSIQVGEEQQALATVEAVLEVAAKDGSDAELQGWVRVPGPLQWRPTGTGMPGLDPDWGTLRPIVTASGTCELPAPDMAQVEREAEQMLKEFDPEGANNEITLWWLAGNGTPTPSGQWLNIITNYLLDNKVPTETAWSVLGHSGVAAFDISIRLWAEKYRHNLLRPESLWFDRHGASAPTLRRETPNHPSYPSGHSGFSAAAATTLVGSLGVDTVAVRDTLPVDVIVPAQERKWDDVWLAVSEASRSRVLSAFHYPLDVRTGEDLGRCVGEQVLKGLTPVLGAETQR